MLWWEEGVIYQIYPRSFADSDGDGIGDLPGITSKLDYVAGTLGVDAIWLSPHYPSPQDDFGYDVADYCEVDPMYGTLDDFDAMVAEARRLGLRVIVDYVINHSSDRNAWFMESAADQSNAKRDWYVWREGTNDGLLPNNWPSFFSGPAWSRHPATGQYYLHSFLASQPDFNWRNPELAREMFDVLRFWMDRGVDGFRIDVAARAMKDPFLRSNPPAKVIDPKAFKFNPEWAATEHIYDGTHPDIHALFRQLRSVLSEYPDRYTVGEIHEWNWEKWASYFGQGDELHQPYNFALLMTGVDAPKIRAIIEGMERVLPPGAWPNWVAGNHDEVRIATRLGGLDQARAMAVLLLTLRGTPTIYYGDELGMVELPVPPDKQQDPFGRRVPGLGRDGCRTPMQWTSGPAAGFTTGQPWLPCNRDYATVNVESQLDDPQSTLSLYRRLLRLRRAEPSLSRGAIELIPSDPSVLAYRRTSPDGPTLSVAANLSLDPVPHPLDGSLILSTDASRSSPTPLLGPWEAVVVR
ncbi:MAG: alpha-amylase family glycosyl hydrolase [Acidimicrobiia bacterium]